MVNRVYLIVYLLEIFHWAVVQFVSKKFYLSMGKSVGNHLSVDLQERVWLAISKEKIPVFSMHFGFFSCPELKNHGLLSWNKTSIVASRESF